MYLDIFLNRIKRLIPRKMFQMLQPAYHFILSFLAAVYYKFPSEELIVIGVTGTTGKTTSVYLIAKVLETAGYKVGYTSTAVMSDGEKEWLNDKKMTMVGRFFTQKILCKMAANNCQYAVIETSSEGIRQFRHKFINYDIAVFTGLYPEHIESHGSFEKYKKAKTRLFAHLNQCRAKYVNEKNKVWKFPSNIKKIDLKRVKKAIIANGNDEHVGDFLNFPAECKIAFTEDNSRDFTAGTNAETAKFKIISSDSRGTIFRFCDTDIKLNFLGGFNAYNAMCAVCVGLGQNLPLDKIKAGLEKIKGVAGRLEIIDEGQNFTVIVDYAFEQKAVGKLYSVVSAFSHNNIIHVLGSCGGGRDVARRPVLGKLAGTYSDFVIVTNEDPYDDDPQMIIDQVGIGAERAGKKLNINLFKISDRREAIKKALSLAGAGDVVLITGKGSEQAICVADGNKIPWDDRTITRKLLNESNLNQSINY